MSEYLPPAGMTLDGAGEALAQALEARDGVVIDSERTFFDTFDALLRADGLALVHEGGHFQLQERDTGVALASVAARAPARPVFCDSFQTGPLRDAVAPIVHPRVLLPQVRIHARARVFSVLDDEGKTVVRMMLEDPAAVAAGGGHTPLRSRLRVSGLRGYDKDLRRVCRTLQDDLGFTVAEQPLVDEAVVAVGGVPHGVPSRPKVALQGDERADAAAVALLRALLEIIEANLEGTLDDTDSEFLHDLRVSVRRTRAVQREFRGVFAPAELAQFRVDFKWLQQATGPARDLDVYVLEFDAMRELVPQAMRADLEPLLTVLRRHRARARAEMERTLRSARFAALREQWSRFLDCAADAYEGARPDCARAIGDLTAARVRSVYGRMVKMGASIDAFSPAEDYHELRKKGKELRYLLELFAAQTHPPEIVRPMIKALKGLQDVLGRHQDREVQMALLRSLGHEVGAMPGGAAGLMATGVLIDKLREDECAARAEFAERFAAFASEEQRRRVQATFARR